MHFCALLVCCSAVILTVTQYSGMHIDSTKKRLWTYCWVFYLAILRGDT